MAPKTKKKNAETPTQVATPALVAAVAESMSQTLGAPEPSSDAVEPESDDAPSAPEPESDEPAKEATWIEHQIERAKRALGHNLLNAQIIRANAEAAGISDEDAKLMVDDIVAKTRAIDVMVSGFIAKLPADFVGVVPTRAGAVRASATGERKGFIAGARVKLVEMSVKKFADLFSKEDLGSLSVVSVAKGGMVILETGTKSRLVISLKQVEPLPVEAAAA